MYRSFGDQVAHISRKNHTLPLVKALGRSFIYNKKIIGPSYDPWGSPTLIGYEIVDFTVRSTFCEFTCFKVTSRFRSLRYFIVLRVSPKHGWMDTGVSFGIIFLKRVFAFIESNNILNNNLFGFRKGWSTNYTIFALLKDVYYYLDLSEALLWLFYYIWARPLTVR